MVKRKRILDIILIVGIFAFLIMIFVVNIMFFNYEINADIASDAILGSMIWNSKEIVPDTWYLANEVRIICTPNIAALFFGLTDNMVLSEGLACCVMTIAILLSIVYFSNSLEWDLHYCLLFCFLCLIIPNNFVGLELLYLFASYYAIHVVVFFITIGTYVYTAKTQKINWVMMIICILLALILGIQGTRGILIIYGPLFGIECIRQIYSLYCGDKKRKLSILGWTVCLLVVSFIGTCFPISVGQDMSRNLRGGMRKLICEVFPDFWSIIGFAKMNLFGKICIICFMAISAGVLIDILWRMCKKKSISVSEWGYLAVCSSPAVSALVVAFTTVESSDRYYFLIYFVMAYGCILACQKMTGKIRNLMVILIFTYSVVILGNVYLPIIKSDRKPETDMYEIIDYLIENNIELSYSTFDYANTITVMANNEIKVAPVASVEKMDICKWMSSTEWYVPYVPYESKTAYIISEPKNESFQIFLDKHEKEVFLGKKIGRYYVYISEYNFSNLGE